MDNQVNQPWELGLDVGTGSIGACVYWLDDEGNIDSKRDPFLVVRSFPSGRDGKTLDSLAAERRKHRSPRINTRRKRRAKQRLLGVLDSAGLQTSPLPSNTWELRQLALGEKLSEPELTAVLLHLLKRRGFKSNRKDKSKDEDAGKIKKASEQLAQQIHKRGVRTAAEIIAQGYTKCFPKRKSTKARLKKGGYDLYPTRKMIADELEKIWQSQKHWHNLPGELWNKVYRIIIEQRPLKPKPVGRCSINPLIERAPKALPVSQRARIYEEVNHLRVISPDSGQRLLTIEERDAIVEMLLRKKKKRWSELRSSRKLPDIGQETRFNFELGGRKGLDGDETAYALSRSDAWGDDWHELSLNQQDAIIEVLLGAYPDWRHLEEVATQVSDALGMSHTQARKLLLAEDDAEIENWLVSHFGLDESRAHKIATAELKSGYGHLGRDTLRAILPHMESSIVKESGERSPMTYDEAVRRAGLGSHSDLDRITQTDRLPYYGVVLQRHVGFGTGDPRDTMAKRYGTFPNPSVHKAINQLGKVVNALIKQNGRPPERITVELARDLPLSAKNLRALRKQQGVNRKRNKEIEKVLNEHNIPVTRDNLLKVKLWEELSDDKLARCCPYTGKQITFEMLWRKDAPVEIDHILPRSRTLDNSFNNLTLCTRQANRAKGDRSPWEAFGHKASGKYKWGDIQQRISKWPKSRKWRFAPDAMSRFEEVNEGLPRHLNDTRYIAKLAKIYLSAITKDVRVLNGKHTALFRSAWGLNSILGGHDKKTRWDLRHHAIDAAVIAAITPAQAKAISTLAKQDNNQRTGDYLRKAPLPYTGFVPSIKRAVNRITVSHKVDRVIKGGLHKDTLYSLEKNSETGPRKIWRVPVDKIFTGSPGKGRSIEEYLLDKAQHIISPAIREKVEGQIKKLLDQGEPLEGIKKEIVAFLLSRNIKRLKLWSTNGLHNLVELPEPSYKRATKGRYVDIEGNHHAVLDRGGQGDGYTLVSNWEAAKKGVLPGSSDDILHKRDTVVYKNKTWLVTQLKDKCLVLRPVNVSSLVKEKEAGYSYPGKEGKGARTAKRVHVDVLGKKWKARNDH